MKLLACLLPLTLLATPRPLGGDTEAALELGREHAEIFYAEEFDALWERLSERMQQALGGSVAGLERAHAQLMSQLGEEVELLSEKAPDVPSGYAYVREVRYSKVPRPMEFVWQFDAEKAVIGFVITPVKKEAESRFLEYRTKTALRLPFEGAWHVFWGGRTLDQNYHTAYPDQRFAYDLLILEDGSTHTGDGKRNEDYHCFGKRLVAPGDGTVVAAANDVPDNVPGEMDPANALGNHVIIDHGNGEFSFLAHFQEGSVQVQVGDEVSAGDFLGLAGNSGNTSEPHLHYHLQTTPDFNAGEGLPSQFLNYVADGEPVERGEPVKGQVIRPAE